MNFHDDIFLTFASKRVDNDISFQNANHIHTYLTYCTIIVTTVIMKDKILHYTTVQEDT
jgi:hypothetical protein